MGTVRVPAFVSTISYGGGDQVEQLMYFGMKRELVFVKLTMKIRYNLGFLFVSPEKHAIETL